MLGAIGIACYFARAPAVDPIEGDGLAGVVAPRPTVQVVRPAVVQASRQVAATGVVSALGGVALRSQVAGKSEAIDFLVPMVISLGGGLLFSSLGVLFLVPAVLVGVEVVALSRPLAFLRRREAGA